LPVVVVVVVVLLIARGVKGVVVERRYSFKAKLLQEGKP
jgi:uncharacterized protein (DUF983 family)